MGSLSNVEASPEVRLLLLFAFVAVGLLLSVQVSQTQADVPLQWTRLTSDTRLYWYALYVLEALLLVQNTLPFLMDALRGYAFENEEQVLNTVWMGILGLEVLMVLGVAVQGVVKKYGPAPKYKEA